MYRASPLTACRQTLRPVCAVVLCALAGWQANAQASTAAGGPSAAASTVEFDIDFLAPGSSKGLDLTRFNRGNHVAAGTYAVDLSVNGGWIGRTDVIFRVADGVDEGAQAQPCFDAQAMARLGIDVEKLAPEVLEWLAAPQACLPLAQSLPEASFDFDFGEQRLMLSVPQMAMSRRARGYVSPEFRDAGVTAGFLDYNFNLYSSRQRHADKARTEGYLGMRWGFNADVWRVRHHGAFSWKSDGGSRYQRNATVVQRDLPSLGAQLTLGEAHTSGELFDSTGFRGVRLATDDRMLPQSLRGYAPVVRGTARSNAKVTVMQGTTVIYETTVAAGAFEIDDLYATGFGGDLSVSVTEADGSVHTFLVPYAAVPLSLRPGMNRYSVTAGTVRDSQLHSSPGFVQATWQHGFSNLLTGYGGVNLAEGHGAVMLGGAFNTSFGAIGVDYTQATTSLNGQPRMSGGSARISYSKDLPQTGGNIALAAYRYSTEGYADFNTAMRMRDLAARGLPVEAVARQRHRTQATFNQKLGKKRGQLQMTVSATGYWNRDASDVGYSVGYSNQYKRMSYGLQVSRQRMANGQSGTRYYANVSIPLGKTDPVMLSASAARDSDGRLTAQSTLSGTAGADGALSYGVTAHHSAGGGREAATGGSANLQYRTYAADLSATLGVSPGAWQASVGARGAVVAHPGGITLSQPVSETFGIVEAPDAEGARVANAAGVRVDSRGYAVVPYLTPYALNSVDIDPKGLSTDVELKGTNQQVAPTAGAVVLLKYATVSGRAVMIRATQADGEPLPFGAVVQDPAGASVGVVGQASRIFARGLEDEGRLTVKWAEGAASQCRIDYQLPTRPVHAAEAKADSYEQIDAVCSAAPAQVAAVPPVSVTR
ncbi:fimbria/pilus outer membrane usher protein [Acidovorax cavernicola]|uniref:Fimbrial biogenesis outer membrane usher protein n=1 Tax=Acidovorax cavernicola TaxID=1675792 RepID=A0A9X8D1A1_9BURK|nr:fimbria/pilus outer membrane usher protein [Acidovorax cavernicola]RIX76070.1 fimbrial biogenesis outer membrane usher protein [Acidovorax cavernicola]